MHIFESSRDPSTGQDIALSTHPALAEYWTTMEPVRDYAHRALSEAHKAAEKDEHPQTLRHRLGLREGWQDALAAWGERAAADQ